MWQSTYGQKVHIALYFALCADPTTFGATLKKMGHKLATVTDMSQDASGTKRPDYLVTDIDVENWGQKREPRKVLVDVEKLRFWGSGGVSDCEMTVPGSELSERVVQFSGKSQASKQLNTLASRCDHSFCFPSGTFEPVKWSCRAPLPSGRLCPRQDRVKCPLHGMIIARDKMGQPSNAEDQQQAASVEVDSRTPDWQDPELLRDIEAQTGINLRVPKKGERGRKTSRKYPGLIDIKKEENTSRKRLEKKVFNRSVMKRVTATMNKIDANRFKDKFADQFNYMFSQ